MPFTTVKAYSAQAAESGAPSAAYTSFATIDGLTRNARVTRLMEFRLASPSTSGSPTSVILDIYRFNEATATVDYLATWTIAATDITAGKVAPIIVETYGNQVMTKVSFSGGTSPTFTGTVQARAVE